MSEDTEVPPLGSDPDVLDIQAMVLMSRAALIRVAEELAAVYAERLTAQVSAETAAQVAQLARKEPDAKVAALTAELAEVRDRAARAAAVVEHGTPGERIEARVRVAACEAETVSLAGRLAQAQEAAAAAATAARRAVLEAKHAGTLAAEAGEALSDPLGHPLGKDTASYVVWVIRSGQWMSRPNSEITRNLLTQFLGPSGLGRQIQMHGIKAYLQGDPAARAVGGTDVTADGHTVTHSPGAPSLVTRNPRLSGQEAREAAVTIPEPPPSDPWTPAPSARPGF